MKKLTKLLSTLVIVSMIFGSLNVSADSTQEEVLLFEEEQITDIDTLIERAKNGITDIPVNESKRSIISLKSNKSIANTQSLAQSTETDELVLEEQYETTQKIKTVQKGNEITETFSTTTIAVLADGSSYQTQPDSSGGVVAYSTVTYDKRQQNNLDTYKLIKVSGGWNRHDSSINMNDRWYTFGASGNSFDGGFAVTQASGKNETSLNAFQKNAPSSWKYVVKDNSTFFVFGVTSSITLTRGTSSKWNILLIHNF
ncbi:hypothetical protein C0Q44_00250 [Paenibacillus sp. PCH8]|uniref:hypothetical protein n=1 Tax=Paenibacillus sp. PCH8 TaxID=2066524 RepID=UPI000CF869A2|nr:hypothetical protein [Paenibacillus sp. PCH8]PQP83203.1 hypothetical protein C0Q44_00250 [Paenibacillus sp. PCH8]